MRMDAQVRSIREAVIEHLKLVASAHAQLRYETDVPIADVPGELISGFCDDLFRPKSKSLLEAFTENELRSLAEFYGRMCVASDAFERDGALSVRAILKIPEWRSVMAFAKDLVVELERGG
jgi:hypothetical protein